MIFNKLYIKCNKRNNNSIYTHRKMRKSYTHIYKILRVKNRKNAIYTFMDFLLRLLHLLRNLLSIIGVKV